MTTSEPTNQNHIQQTLFAVDSLAKTSQSQVEAKASRRKQGLVYSMNSSESYAWYDQDSSSWKTSQRSLITGWTSFSESFTRQGYMNANGHVFQRQWLEPVTSVTGGGLLPTPLASDPERKAKFKQGGTPLMGALLPTPKATEITETPQQWAKRSAKPANKNFGPSLNVKLQILNEIGEVPNQAARSYFLPTPRASEWKGCGQVGSKSSLKWKEQGYLSGVLNETCSPQTGEATHLNPSFVEEMMGYPIGWTDLER